MAYIKLIGESEATGPLKREYESALRKLQLAAASGDSNGGDEPTG